MSVGVLDIIVIAILALFAVIGFIKGFLNTILSLFGNLASLAVAIVIVKPCARFFDSIFHLVDKLGGAILNGLGDVVPTIEAGSTMTGQEVITHMTGENGKGLIGRLASLFVDSSATYGTAADGQTLADGVLSLTDTLSKGMGQFVTTVITVVVMFILIRIGVLILSKIFDAITKKRALSGLDRLLGLVSGIVKGAVIITAALSVMYALSPLIPAIDQWISQAKFTSWLYGYVNQLINWAINNLDWKSFGMIS